MSDKEEILKKFEDISQEKDRGILKRVITPGKDNLKAFHKDTCTVRYVGTYWGGEEDGKEFDKNDSFDFQLGVKDVIKAWDVCVATMNIGESCELIASPENCYNDGKSMKFEIELFSAKGQDVSDKKDGTVRKSVMEEGDGLVNPPYGVEAKISYKIIGDSQWKDVSYLTGDAESHNLPVSLDMAVRSMTLNELAKVTVSDPSKGDSITNYSVKLNNFEKLKHLSTLPNFEEQMKYAETLKERANGHLKLGKYSLALHTYERLINDLEYLVTNGPDEQKKLDALKAMIHNNCALTNLKLKKLEDAITQCKKALEIDYKSEKALFRLGQAYLQLNDHEEALNNFKRCVHYHQNSDAMKMKEFCENTIAKAKKMEKARFRGIYNRLKDTGLGLPDEPEPMDSNMDYVPSDASSDNEAAEAVAEA